MNELVRSTNNEATAGNSISPEEIQSFITDLGGRNRESYQKAYQSLKALGESAVNPLVEALANPNEEIRWEANKLLGEIKVDWTTYADDETINALIADLANPNGFKRMRARRALAQIGTRAVGMLIQALSSEKGIKRWEAAKALSQIGDPSATAALIKFLTDKNFDIRWLSAEGLISIGEPALIPLLHELINNPESEWLKEGAHHYLHAVNNEKLNVIVTPLLRALEGSETQLEVPLAAEKTLISLSNK